MKRSQIDPFGAREEISLEGNPVTIHRLDRLEAQGLGPVSTLPYSVRILLEAVLRQVDGSQVTAESVAALAAWEGGSSSDEIPFKPARVLMQDFTGVPGLVDLAALRLAMKRLGGDPARINPLIPVDLVIDHSVQIDRAGSDDAIQFNANREFERNMERYAFLRWGAAAFRNLRVVPPATGIVHQVNLEYLASVLQVREADSGAVAFPDSLVGTDSHTTMINGLGVVGWGVGGIEAEAAVLGQPVYLLPPAVVGLRLDGRLPEGATATDLVLTVTETLRAHGVVGKFVEFHGPGLHTLGLADRATMANMAPEYGATMGYFPVDDETLVYLRGTGRDPQHVAAVERYFKEQGLFHTTSSPTPRYSENLSVDMSTVVPSLAGPRRPQDRVALSDVKNSFHTALKNLFGDPARVTAEVETNGAMSSIGHGAVVIAAITSCTNTSNPSVMIGAGLLARNAVARGLSTKPWVKTSLAPGSTVVTRYLEDTGLLNDLEALRFHVVGYGCTTCIGNSGPIAEPIVKAIRGQGVVAAAVLSGNRNFEGRISPHVAANYLASPPLVVAYALAGTLDIDLARDALGSGSDGEPVYLRDIWPAAGEIRDTMSRALRPEVFSEAYRDVFSGNERWNDIPAGKNDLYEWQEDSTYIREPSFFSDMKLEPAALEPIHGARVLAVLGDSVTTDHISPAGAIPADGPAGRYLIERGISRSEFNSFGSRRGNHEVMVRDTFGNIRIRNRLAPGTEGGVTRHLPSGEQMSIYDAAVRYREEGVPLLVIAGKQYGTGSSRDWAAKGTLLLGVRAVLAESYERIHRSNLVGMGVLPLQFQAGESLSSLGLTGEEVYSVNVPDGGVRPGSTIEITALPDGRGRQGFTTVARIDSPAEAEYYRHGGILQDVLRGLLRSA
ncbi:MAG: aconitate hydratase AcnA [Acidobacteriota bacterium]